MPRPKKTQTASASKKTGEGFPWENGKSGAVVSAKQLDEQRAKVERLKNEVAQAETNLKAAMDDLEQLGRQFMEQMGLGQLIGARAARKPSGAKTEGKKRGRKGGTKEQFAEWAKGGNRTREEGKEWFEGRGLNPNGLNNYVGKGKDFIFQGDLIKPNGA